MKAVSDKIRKQFGWSSALCPALLIYTDLEISREFGLDHVLIVPAPYAALGLNGAERGWRWKDGLERYVRQSCDTLGIQRRGVHGFRATAACEFVDIKTVMGYTEMEARRELAIWLGHNLHRTEVTYAYTCPGGQCQGVPHDR